jgi:ABC-2 type transport system permease protein
MYWSMRREFWEYRVIYLAPLAVAALVLFGFLISTLTLPYRMRTSAFDPDQLRYTMVEPYEISATLILGAAFIVGIFYCLDALHGERRDRSILFWKSLPVSDLTTVLAKALIAGVILPLLGFAITVVTMLIMLVLNTVVLFVSGLSVTPLWTQVPIFQISLILFYHFLTAHTLWYAPFYAWMLLVSGWARRVTFLWAVLPPFAICVVEKFAFHTSHFANLLLYRLQGPEEFNLTSGHGVGEIIPLTQLAPLRFLGTPGLWTGLALAAVLLLAAAWQRRYRGPI